MDFEIVLDELSAVRGTLGCAVVDYSTGMVLEGRGAPEVNLDMYALANTEIVREELKTIDMIYGMEDEEHTDAIEDILITLKSHYHLLRPMACYPGLFMFTVLDRKIGNLALSRHALRSADYCLKKQL